jgi:hypothetical protein
MAAAAVLAWLGMYVHNVADLPNLTLLSAENALPGLVWLLLLGWGLLNLVGAFATVLPLPVLPFKPEQSLHHYVFHVVYALTQLPLLWIVRQDRHQVRSHRDLAGPT